MQASITSLGCQPADADQPPVAGSAAPKVASLENVSKFFGGVTALRDVSFDLRAGEVLALLGENGAGKSTCVKLLAGVHTADEGQVLIDGIPALRASPVEMRRRGVAVMHQHPGLFGDLPVYENIFMGHMPQTSAGILDERAMQQDAKALLKAVGLSCPVNQLLHQLRTSEQQLVEIARALSADAKVLIMDEPTASLSLREVERLFTVVAELKARGVAMMFVSHRMDEIYRIADQIAVLRDGQLITVQPTRSLDRDRAVQAMIGRPLSSIYPGWESRPGAKILEVDNLSRAGVFKDVSFSVRSGEVVGLGGLVGSGRTEVARALFGIDRPDSGTIRIDGTPAVLASPSQAVAAGIAYVSEDRLGQSLVMDFSIMDNASLPVIGQTTRWGLILRKLELALIRPNLDRLRLKFASFDQPVSTLSGGNQQKVVLSKWLATKPRILILDEPTQGIDVQSKAEVHSVIAELAQQGLAIILISSELPELVGMCDRVIVLREGVMTGAFDRSTISPEGVIRAATDVDEISMTVGSGEAMAPRPPAPSAAPVSPVPKQHLRSWRELGLLCVIAMVLIPVSLINPHMLSVPNITALSMDAALLSIVAVAQMLVVLTRNIDLSVASVIGLAGYGAASFMQHYPESPVIAGVGVAVLIGAACGLINGLVVTLGQVPSIVVTLGTLAVFRGVDSMWNAGRQISADQVPERWLDMSTSTMLGIPVLVVFALGVLIVAGLALKYTAMGRQLFAIGSNPEGASLIGLPKTSLLIGTFAISGVLAGFDGALWASRYATVDARLATGFELTVIAAVVVGGVAIRGGAGSVLGVAFGALALLIIQNGLTLVRVDPLWLQGVYGLVILVAIGVDALVTRSARKGRA